MQVFALLSGMQDRRHGHSWEAIRPGIWMLLGLTYVIFCTPLATLLYHASVLLVPTSRATPCTVLGTGHSWFLLSLALMKGLGCACTLVSSKRTRRWLPAVAAVALHFLCFSGAFPWPFVRSPLQQDPQRVGSWFASRRRS